MHKLFAVLIDGVKSLNNDSEEIRNKAIWKTEHHHDKLCDWREESDAGRWNNAEPFEKYKDQDYVIFGTDDDFEDVLYNLAEESKLKDIDLYLEDAIERLDGNDPTDPEFLKSIVKDVDQEAKLRSYFMLLEQIMSSASYSDQFYSAIQDTYSLTKWDKEQIANESDDVALVLFDYHY